MSALAAVFVFGPDAPAPDPVCVEHMLAAMPERAPEGRRIQACGPAVLGHGLFRVLPEDAPGAQPARSHDGTVTLVLDGRLDNRDEVMALAGRRAEGQSDAVILAEALAAAGERVWARALGDLAAIAWDGRQRRLTAFRDAFGLRPLHYAVVGDRVFMASDLRALHTLVPSRLDEGVLGEWLTGGVNTLTGTPLAAVSRIAPGHVLTVSRSAIQHERVVTIGGLPPARRPLPSLYEEFLHLFDEAVRARLRHVGRAGVLLSAGLDSTTVYLRGRRFDAGLDAFTVDQRPGFSETTVAASTARGAGGTHHVAPATAGEVDYAEAARRWLVPPPHPAAANSAGARHLAAATGCRVLLNGLGGDEFFGINPWAGADLLGSGRVVELARAWRRLHRHPSSVPWSALAYSAVVPLAPGWLRAAARRVPTTRRLPPWIGRRWARDIGLPDRIRAREALTGGSVAERVVLAEVLGGVSMQANEDGERLAAMTGVDDRSPYFDRRLATFALGLPAEVVATAVEPKAFVREAGASWLPAAQRHAVRAPGFAHLEAEALQRIGGPAFFDDLQVVARGYVDGAWVRRARDVTWPAGGGAAREDSPHLTPLWTVASVELCVRALSP